MKQDRFKNSKEINYQDAVDLEFKRQDITDSVIFRKTGYKGFLLQKQISKTLYFDWDFESRKVELIRTNKSGNNVLNRFPVYDISMLLYMNSFLTINRKFMEGYEDPWENFNQMWI